MAFLCIWSSIRIFRFDFEVLVYLLADEFVEEIQIYAKRWASELILTDNERWKSQ